MAAVESSANGSEVVQGFTKKGLEEFNAHFHSLVDEGKLANVVTLVSRHGQIVNLDAYGVLDVSVSPPVEVKTDSIYRIASMTKPITGVVMMMLYEEGKWALDDPVAKYIPEFEGLKVKLENGDLVPQDTPMTMAQLMSHTAGFGRGSEYATSGLRDGNLQDMIDKLAKLPLSFQPGKEWRYGPSVDIQGYLVEKLSGQGLDEFCEKRLFGPLGMADTGFWIDPGQGSRIARIHKYDSNGKLCAAGASNVFSKSKPKFLAGGGGLLSKIEDYWRFTQMVLNGGEFEGKRYLKSSTVQLMRTNVLEPAVNVTLYSPDTRGEEPFLRTHYSVGRVISPILSSFHLSA
jgi:CubicO group peptidase (beta-lactamase class C family)